MSEWKQRSIERRDFRHQHGEPEVPRWRKKAVKHDRAHCAHEWSEWESRETVLPRRLVIDRPDGFKKYTERTAIYSNRYCVNCKKRQYRRRTIERSWHYHWDKLIFSDVFEPDWKTRW